MSSSATTAGDDGARILALAAALVVLATVMTVFHDLTATFGGTPWLVAYVATAFAGATLAARRAPTRVGLVAATALLAGGLAGYLVLLPAPYQGLFSVDALAEDLVGWLTGRSVVLMLEADLWAVSVAPAPVFLVWYLALRGRYDGAALAGGAALGFFVLTGDLDDTLTLVGMAGLLGLVGFGAVATTDGGWRQLQEIGLIVGIAMLLTRFVQVVPASGVASVDVDDDGSEPLERQLLSDPDRLSVGGRPSLSPTPRYTVRAEQRAYWHTRSFDRYTGTGWRRTDRGLEDGPLRTVPPSAGTILEQTFTVRRETNSMPAAWRPVRLGLETGLLGDLTDTGNIEPDGPVPAGTSYDVVSRIPAWTAEELSSAGRAYPGLVEDRYTQLPGDLPERLVAKTDEIVADAEGPYETALAVQRWLTENKGYSLSVEPQNWDVADAFVFALDAGYCVYFATTMAVMLRTQGIPARFVAGYAPGERQAEGEWLVRGYHAHAWVEVFFPDVGWVTFDPTPSDPRRRAQERELERAEAVQDAPGQTARERTPTPASDATATRSSATPTDTSNSTRTGTRTDGSPAGAGRETMLPDTPTRAGGAPRGAVRADDGTPTPASGDGGPRDRLWLVGALATLAFGSIRLGYAQSAFRSVWMRWQPRSDDPDADVERALARLEYHLASRFRPRREGETRQQYLAELHRDPVRSLDDRTWRVLDAYQESRYGAGVDEATADEVVAIVDDVVRR